ncbi:MAG TPA: hypothetical protein VGW38_01450 [Chloroflexota bacterium]|nr:hypothetical protein [Chloroflexota bacterium]
MATDRAILLRDAGRGVPAGLIGATFQVVAGWLLAKVLLPEGQDNNIAPRLVQRTLATLGRPEQPVRDWLLGSLFHFGYGAGWGIALARGRTLARLPGVLVAFPISLMIYLVAFSRVGAGTILQVEEHPTQRPMGKKGALLGVVVAYTLSTGLLLDRLGRRDEGVTVRPIRHDDAQEAAGPDRWF